MVHRVRLGSERPARNGGNRDRAGHARPRAHRAAEPRDPDGRLRLHRASTPKPKGITIDDRRHALVRRVQRRQLRATGSPRSPVPAYTEYVPPCLAGAATAPGSCTGSALSDVAAGRDGAIWYTNELKRTVGRLVPDQTVYGVPARRASGPGSAPARRGRSASRPTARCGSRFTAAAAAQAPTRSSRSFPAIRPWRPRGRSARDSDRSRSRPTRRATSGSAAGRWAERA